MPRLAQGSRDESGVWRPDDPSVYPPLDVHGTLPWSVLRQDSAPWQARKRWWLELGVDTPAPRAHAAGMIATGRHGAVSGGVSRFDPHLAELLYTWYCPPGGLVVDPCAGGAVRGLVAAHLGYRYIGVDLSADQVDANRALTEGWSERSLLRAWPRWRVGDGRDLIDDVADAARDVTAGSTDYLLSCPPYHNRERYSDDPCDLSAMTWAGFVDAHARLVHAAVAALRPDRFATWVISDVRDHRGHYRRLPALAAEHFERAGCRLVNEQILVAPTGTLRKVMRPAWEAARTTTRHHQMVLTFVKGDRRAAARAVRGG